MRCASCRKWRERVSNSAPCLVHCRGLKQPPSRDLTLTEPDRSSCRRFAKRPLEDKHRPEVKSLWLVECAELSDSDGVLVLGPTCPITTAVEALPSVGFSDGGIERSCVQDGALEHG